MSAGREFSEDALALAGRPTVDLIADALAEHDYARVGSLLEQLHSEVGTMLYGYLSWPKVIRRSVKAGHGLHTWEQVDKAARAALASEPPPADQVFAAWDDYKRSLSDAARVGDGGLLDKGSREWHAHALAVHDSYMNYAAILVSELARRFGPDYMQQVLTEVMDPDAMGIRPEMPFRQRVEALIKFTRLHLLPFRLIEDDQKMTFIASPCPSGGRQVLAGLYHRDGPGELIAGSSPVTYHRHELPSYCCHESALEAASIRRFGSPVFIVDPADRLGHQPCHVYVYKDPASIPEHYYQRVGLTRQVELIASS